MMYIFSLIILRPQRYTLFPYTTLFRSSDSNIRYLKYFAFKYSSNRIKRQLRKSRRYTQRGEYQRDYKIQNCLELARSEEHTSELQSRENLVCRLLLEKKK